MLDKKRILTKIDELDSYLNEISQIIPANFSEYQQIEKKRTCERLLQLGVECTIDICRLFVSGLRLGLPSEENDLFAKLKKKGIISKDMASLLKEMRGFRNILIHPVRQHQNIPVSQSQSINKKVEFQQSIKKLGASNGVHEYATVNDELVYEALQTRLADFKRFKKEILEALKKF